MRSPKQMKNFGYRYSAFLLLGSVAFTQEHSLVWSLNQNEATTRIHFQLTDGLPFKNAEYAVIQPGTDSQFQRGITDDSGYAVISPNRPGIWTVEVHSKSNGHGTVALIEVKADGQIRNLKRQQPSSNRWQNVGLAAATLLGIFGIAHLTNVWWARRNRAI